MNVVALVNNVRVGIDALRVHPLRTMLSILGIIIGSASLVAIMAVSDGIMAFIRGRIEHQTSVQVVSLGSRTSDFRNGEWVRITDYPVFTERDAADARREITGVRSTTLLLSASASARYRSVERRMTVTLGGAELPEFGDVKLAAGRFFSATEASYGRGVIVLNHELARDLSPGGTPEDLLDQEIRVGRGVVRVVGVLARDPFEDPRNPSFRGYLPYRAVATVLDPPPTGRFTPTIQLKAANVEGVNALKAAAQDWLAQRYLRWQDRVRVDVRMEELAEVERGILLAKIFLGTLVGISLVVGGIGIMNVLLASIAERTREIGIRKAIGASSRDIRSQFLAESVAISAAGTMLGVVSGVALAFVVTAGFRYFTQAPVYPVITPATLALALGTSALIGLVFGTYPARRAARLQPIQAIGVE